jgi:hypothetical protein
MFRRLMASTAVLALMSAAPFVAAAQDQQQPAQGEQPALVQQDQTTAPAGQSTKSEVAQDQTQPTAEGETEVAEDAQLKPEEPTIATAFIGQSVFSSEDPESDNIGEVKDLIIDDDGMITHAVIGVGGFLGIGEKEVAVPFDELQVVEQEGEIRLVFVSTREQLEAAEEFDRTAYDPRARFQEEQAAMAPAPDAGMGAAPGLAPAPAGDMAAAPAAPEQPADAAAPAEGEEQTAATEQPADATQQPAEGEEETAAAEQPADATQQPAEG